MKDLFSLGTYCWSLYFISTRFLKYNIYGVHVPQFKLDYIHDKNHHPHRNLVKLCRKVNYMWWGNKYLELQDWENFIKSNKTRVLAIIMLVTKNNPQGYK